MEAYKCHQDVDSSNINFHKQVTQTDEINWQNLTMGVLKFGFGTDVLLHNLKVDSYKYQFFKKKWPIHIPIGPIFGEILSKNHTIFPKFS